MQDCFDAYLGADAGWGLDAVYVQGSRTAFFDFERAAEHDITNFQAPSLDLTGAGPHIRSANLVQATDEAQFYPPANALVSRIAVIDKWTPNTDWGGGMLAFDPENGGYTGDRQGTYPTIEPTLHEPLEGPRYSYAGMDSEEIFAEAQQRVTARFNSLLGK